MTIYNIYSFLLIIVYIVCIIFVLAKQSREIIVQTIFTNTHVITRETMPV